MLRWARAKATPAPCFLWSCTLSKSYHGAYYAHLRGRQGEVGQGHIISRPNIKALSYHHIIMLSQGQSVSYTNLRGRQAEVSQGQSGDIIVLGDCVHCDTKLMVP
jgi:hypothetical protein